MPKGSKKAVRLNKPTTKEYTMENQKRRWTDKDNQILRKAAGSKAYLTIVERIKVAKRLKRTYYAVGMQLHRIELVKNSQPSRPENIKMYKRIEALIRKGVPIQEAFQKNGYYIGLAKIKTVNDRHDKYQSETR